MTAFVVGFAGAVALWWLYFDQSAEAAAEEIAGSDDPGRLGRSAYHLIHPVMVAGIIVSAAADQKALSDPAVTASTASTWLILADPGWTGPVPGRARRVQAGGLALRVLAAGSRVAVLALLGLAATSIPELGLAACAAGVVAAVAASDRLPWAPHPPR